MFPSVDQGQSLLKALPAKYAPGSVVVYEDGVGYGTYLQLFLIALALFALNNMLWYKMFQKLGVKQFIERKD